MPNIIRRTAERLAATPNELVDLAQASPEQKSEKRSHIVRANFELLNEWTNTLGWIPVAGDLLKSEVQRGKNATLLFWGINEQGELVPPDQKGIELFKGYSQEVQHRFGAVLDALLIFGVPELALGKLALGTNKTARAASIAKKAYTGWKTYRNAEEIYQELQRIHAQGGVDLKPALIATPYLLGRFKGKPGGEHLDKLATSIERIKDKDQAAALLQQLWNSANKGNTPDQDRYTADQLLKLQQTATA